jgi:hypothetical protein
VKSEQTAWFLGMTMALRQLGWRRRQRGREKFWQADGVQVKIVWLGFKDRTAGGFIGGQ